MDAFNNEQLAEVGLPNRLCQQYPAPNAPSYEDVMDEISSQPAYMEPMTDDAWRSFASELVEVTEAASSVAMPYPDPYQPELHPGLTQEQHEEQAFIEYATQARNALVAERAAERASNNLPPSYNDALREAANNCHPDDAICEPRPRAPTDIINMRTCIGLIVIGSMVMLYVLWIKRYYHFDAQGRAYICVGGITFGLPRSWQEFMGFFQMIFGEGDW